jgi:hypothetical protein
MMPLWKGTVHIYPHTGSGGIVGQSYTHTRSPGLQRFATESERLLQVAMKLPWVSKSNLHMPVHVLRPVGNHTLDQLTCAL